MFIASYSTKPSSSGVFDSHRENGGRRTGNFSCMKHSHAFSLRTVWVKRYYHSGWRRPGYENSYYISYKESEDVQEVTQDPHSSAGSG